jgi:polysaccharide pyruvyl transferase WcaK-like protein
LRVGFWGNFGTDNLGNECTLHAMLDGARRHVAKPSLVGLCLEPHDTVERHHIDALPIAVEPSPSFLPLPGPLARLRRPVWELADWLRVLRAMRTLDMVVVTGTGIITDTHEGKLGMPYQMFKWVVAARLLGRKVKFVSVGAEGLKQPLQLFFLRWSLRLAEYRSYRDGITRQRTAGLLPLASEDPLYPDLAFSLPKSLLSIPRKGPSEQKTVAVGIYAVEKGGEAAKRSYIETIGTFVIWLLDHGYRTRIVIGDVQYDLPMLEQLREWLRAHSALDRVVDESVASFEDLLLQLAEADLVVATRFHNVLLSILLEKPVVSLSHMDKNDALMQSFGLSGYVRDLQGLHIDTVIALFQELERNSDSVRAAIQEKLELFRNQLEQQYSIVFDGTSDSLSTENP